jgi:hypothetical protein
MTSIAECIAEELRVRLPQVQAAIALLDEKATVPFIARYRKEATGGLDDTQLRALDERLNYLRELEERRAAILASTIRASSRRSSRPRFATRTKAARRSTRLYKPKRRTKAQIAREAGLNPGPGLPRIQLVPAQGGRGAHQRGRCDAAALGGAVDSDGGSRRMPNLGGLRVPLGSGVKSTVFPEGRRGASSRTSARASSSEKSVAPPALACFAVAPKAFSASRALRLRCGGPTGPSADRGPLRHRAPAGADGWLVETVRS